MAFKLTYTDGQESDYDDGTKWDVEGGVLKLGREDGEWSVFVSPGHWATIEVVKGKETDRDGARDEAKGKDADRDSKDEKKDDKEDEDAD
jgi:hypothetical protein